MGRRQAAGSARTTAGPAGPPSLRLLTAPVIVREVLAGEMDAVGALRVEAYQAQNLLAGAPSYVEELRNLGTGGHGTVLVAVTGTELLGTVTLETWHSGSEIARDTGHDPIANGRRLNGVQPGPSTRVYVDNSLARSKRSQVLYPVAIELASDHPR